MFQMMASDIWNWARNTQGSDEDDAGSTENATSGDVTIIMDPENQQISIQPAIQGTIFVLLNFQVALLQ